MSSIAKRRERSDVFVFHSLATTVPQKEWPCLTRCGRDDGLRQTGLSWIQCWESDERWGSIYLFIPVITFFGVVRGVVGIIILRKL